MTYTNYIKHKKNEFIELTLKQMLNHHLINNCTNCGSKRIKVTFEVLPEEMKKEIKEILEEGCYFLHCENCQGYSVVINQD
jgi:hypothetical protein